MLYILLFLTIISNVVAQLLLKKGTSLIALNTININSILKIAMSPYILTGLFLYGMSFVFYILVLSKAELSKAAPTVQAMTILLIVLISVFFLNEPFGFSKAAGIILVLIGVFLLML